MVKMPAYPGAQNAKKTGLTPQPFVVMKRAGYIM
jgi:hypothetical protein